MANTADQIRELMEEIEVNPDGGAGSKIPWWELLDYRALDRVAKVFEEGARKYARDNWRAVPVAEHIRHAVKHAYEFLESIQQYTMSNPHMNGYQREGISAEQDRALAHFACRAIMALAVRHQDPGIEKLVPKGLACKPEDKS